MNMILGYERDKTVIRGDEEKERRKDNDVKGNKWKGGGWEGRSRR